MQAALKSTLAKNRRALPGSGRFITSSGPAMIVCGTRRGISLHGAAAKRLPQHILIAPMDLDPGSVRWPVEDAPGITLLCADAPDEYVLRLTQALLGDGANLIVQIRTDGSHSIHRRLT